MEIVKLVVLAKNDCDCLYCSSTYSNVTLKNSAVATTEPKKLSLTLLNLVLVSTYSRIYMSLNIYPTLDFGILLLETKYIV